MATLNPFAEILGAELTIPPNTLIAYAKAMRLDGLFSQGRRGPNSVPLTNGDAVNLLLAALLDHAYGEGVSIAVRRARDLPFSDKFALPEYWPPPSRCFFATKTAGEALDILFDDMRHGPLDGKFYVSLDSSGRELNIHFSKKEVDALAMVTFADPKLSERAPGVVRSVTIAGAVLERLAAPLN